MKILHASFAFPSTPDDVSDGVTYVLSRQAKELVKRGHEVTVYACLASSLHRKRGPSTGRTLLLDGIEVHYFPWLLRYATFFFTPTLFFTAIREIRKFDVVHIHDARSFQGLLTAYCAQKYGVPYVFQPHGSFISPLPGSVLRRFLRSFLDKTYSERILRNCARIIALSNAEVEVYLSHGIPRDKTVLIPNGIDMSEYENLPVKGSFRRRHGIDENIRIVLYLGRIVRMKGIDYLIEAWGHLVKHLRFKNALLVIAGPDDGYLRELQALIKALNIDNDVLVSGPLFGRDKLEAYVDADICVLPSRYEMFGLGVLEAYACGKAVIASNLGGLKDLVANGVTGLLVEPDKVKQFAGSILRLLDNSDEAKNMGLRGNEFLKASFSIEEIVTEIEDLYRQILRGCGRA